MHKTIAYLRHWLEKANVDLSGVAITIHVKRDRDAYALRQSILNELDLTSIIGMPIQGPDRFNFMGLPIEIKVDGLQRDLDLR